MMGYLVHAVLEGELGRGRQPHRDQDERDQQGPSFLRSVDGFELGVPIRLRPRPGAVAVVPTIGGPGPGRPSGRCASAGGEGLVELTVLLHDHIMLVGLLRQSSHAGDDGRCAQGVGPGQDARRPGPPVGQNHPVRRDHPEVELVVGHEPVDHGDARDGSTALGERTRVPYVLRRGVPNRAQNIEGRSVRSGSREGLDGAVEPFRGLEEAGA